MAHRMVLFLLCLASTYVSSVMMPLVMVAIPSNSMCKTMAGFGFNRAAMLRVYARTYCYAM